LLTPAFTQLQLTAAQRIGGWPSCAVKLLIDSRAAALCMRVCINPLLPLLFLVPTGLLRRALAVVLAHALPSSWRQALHHHHQQQLLQTHALRLARC
jgi:hypothetical protein